MTDPAVRRVPTELYASQGWPAGDRALLVEGLGSSPASMHQPTVEAAIAAAGFEVVRASRSPASGRSTSWSTTLAT